MPILFGRNRALSERRYCLSFVAILQNKDQQRYRTVGLKKKTNFVSQYKILIEWQGLIAEGTVSKSAVSARSSYLSSAVDLTIIAGAITSYQWGFQSFGAFSFAS